MEITLELLERLASPNILCHVVARGQTLFGGDLDTKGVNVAVPCEPWEEPAALELKAA